MENGSNESPGKKQGRFRQGKRLLIVLVLVASLVGTAVAITAFTHYFGSVTISPVSTTSFLKANCGTTAASPLQPSPSSVTTGAGGLILFSCGAAGAALTVELTGGTATPTFTLPNAYVTGSLNLVIHNGNGCPAQPPILGIGALTSGSAFNFNPNMVSTQFDYCVWIDTSATPQTVSTFTVSWA